MSRLRRAYIRWKWRRLEYLAFKQAVGADTNLPFFSDEARQMHKLWMWLMDKNQRTWGV